MQAYLFTATRQKIYLNPTNQNNIIEVIYYL